MASRTEGLIRVGTAGWSYPDWEGLVYPSPRPRGFDPLHFLSGLFDVIEINSTFYRPAERGMAASWLAREGAVDLDHIEQPREKMQRINSTFYRPAEGA